MRRQDQEILRVLLCPGRPVSFVWLGKVSYIGASMVRSLKVHTLLDLHRLDLMGSLATYPDTCAPPDPGSCKSSVAVVRGPFADYHPRTCSSTYGWRCLPIESALYALPRSLTCPCGRCILLRSSRSPISPQ